MGKASVRASIYKATYSVLHSDAASYLVAAIVGAAVAAAIDVPAVVAAGAAAIDVPAIVAAGVAFSSMDSGWCVKVQTLTLLSLTVPPITMVVIISASSVVLGISTRIGEVLPVGTT